MCGFSAQEKISKRIGAVWQETPMVGYVKHLGNTIINNIDYVSQDTIEKRAYYIIRNNELSQEFSFAHPTTKCLINNIFNTHFTGGICSTKPPKCSTNLGTSAFEQHH